MERIVIETDPVTKLKLKDLANQERKTMKVLIGEAIAKLLKRLK
jgi:predicted transcriptional regulator